MFNELRKKIKVIVKKDKEKILAKDLVVLEFYQEGIKKLRILQKAKGERQDYNRKTGRNIQTYRDLENGEEMKKITEYHQNIRVSTKFIGENGIDYMRI